MTNIPVVNNSRDSKLSSSITISSYEQLESLKDRDKIADFIKERFTERYITPLKGENKHGFCTMAISCLMIESLESFRQGWENTKNKSEKAFISFFNRRSGLVEFEPYVKDFYVSVRCGILHQGETTGGWHIRRDGLLFDSSTKTVNATKFHNELAKYLDLYCDELKKSNWNDAIWKNLITKMKAICKNCS